MNNNKKLKRQLRIRKKIKKKANDRYRLSVFRSLNNIYAQIIDDNKGTTLLSASTLDKKVKSKFKNTGNKEAASEIGKILAEKAKEKGGIRQVGIHRRMQKSSFSNSSRPRWFTKSS